MVIWNVNDKCFECSQCGGRYNDLELGRMFNYTNEIKRECFTPTHCMDCGILWKECKLEEIL